MDVRAQIRNLFLSGIMWASNDVDNYFLLLTWILLSFLSFRFVFLVGINELVVRLIYSAPSHLVVPGCLIFSCVLPFLKYYMMYLIFSWFQQYATRAHVFGGIYLLSHICCTPWLVIFLRNFLMVLIPLTNAVFSNLSSNFSLLYKLIPSTITSGAS